jgi:hypothetical protein
VTIRPAGLDLPSDSKFDAVLIERGFCNLIENATEVLGSDMARPSKGSERVSIDGVAEIHDA